MYYFYIYKGCSPIHCFWCFVSPSFHNRNCATVSVRNTEWATISLCNHKPCRNFPVFKVSSIKWWKEFYTNIWVQLISVPWESYVWEFDLFNTYLNLSLFYGPNVVFWHEGKEYMCFSTLLIPRYHGWTERDFCAWKIDNLITSRP